MKRRTHLCLSVKGFLSGKRKKKDWEIFEDDNGRILKPDKAKEYLLQELSEGHLYLPIGECDNFDYNKGCRGHDIIEENGNENS